MNLGFSQSLSLSQNLSLRQTQRLSLAQSQVIQLKQATLRLELIESIWGMKYTPRARCKHCSHELTLLEVLKGFSDDVDDTSVTCPVCLKQIRAYLVAKFKTGESELPFYCGAQALDRLDGLEDLSYDELNKQHGVLLHSAIVHYGNISAAFAKLNIDYPLSDKIKWKEKIKGFLGELPDGQIADVVGVSRYQITKFRKSQGIKGFKKRNLLPT